MCSESGETSDGIYVPYCCSLVPVDGSAFPLLSQQRRVNVLIHMLCYSACCCYRLMGPGSLTPLGGSWRLTHKHHITANPNELQKVSTAWQRNSRGSRKTTVCSLRSSSVSDQRLEVPSKRTFTGSLCQSSALCVALFCRAAAASHMNSIITFHALQ